MLKSVSIIFISFSFKLACGAQPICSSKDQSNLAIDQFCNSLSAAAALCASDSRCFWAQNGKNTCNSKDVYNLALHQFCNSLNSAGEITCNLQDFCVWSN